MRIPLASIGQAAFEMSKTDEPDFVPWRKVEPSRRHYRRWQVEVPTVVTVAGQPLDCVMRDLSPGGAGLELVNTEKVAVGAEVTLHLEEFGWVPAEVRYSEGGYLGLMFLHGEAKEVELARYLVSLQPARRPERVKTKSEAVLTQRRRQSPSIVEDISRTGAGVLVDDTLLLTIGDEVVLSIEGHGDIVARVRRIAGGKIGLAFLEELTGELPS